MYSNYDEAGGFQIKKAGQKTTKSGIVTLKYLMCNKEGAPRHVNIDTLDAKHSGKQKRQTTIHVTGYKACIRLELDIVTRRYKLRKINKELEKEQAEEEETEAKREFIDYKVMRIIEDGSVVCTCRHFDRFGFLCRHIFCVFKNRDINVIPEQYILRRWTRDIIPPELRRKRNRYGEKMLGDKVEKMEDFVEKLKKLRTEVEAEVPNHPSIETGDVIGEHFAISKPDKKQLTIRQR
ncbi:FAR1 DNA binding domain-containing protein [Artemisia annua]|uniref:FAR1 DNA binding domain-containing protein n=1 Tax=Artemisia annua TaxID=35608 RepID=A0A2U1LS06_ARTAN|nr:FAR1 DNA binding domain-containing protein [Artemisia annua]